MSLTQAQGFASCCGKNPDNIGGFVCFKPRGCPDVITGN